MVGPISAGEICLRVRGRDCLKYLKVGETKKRGGETKFLKRGGKLGQGVGLLKKGGGGLEPSYPKTNLKEFRIGIKKVLEKSRNGWRQMLVPSLCS